VSCVRHLANGTPRREVRTFKTMTKELLALSDWLASEGCTHIAMEATGVYWKPVWHILSDGDFTLVLANAAHVKNVPGRKTDVNDATWLADLLAHGLIRGSFVPDEQTQQMRTLLRTRKQLVRESSRHVQRLQKTLEDANIKLDWVICDVMGLSGRKMIEALIGGESDPERLAQLAHRRIKATPEMLREPCAVASLSITASCCACICSRSTPSTRQSNRSIRRSTSGSSPFAPQSYS